MHRVEVYSAVKESIVPGKQIEQEVIVLSEISLAQWK